MAAAGLKNPINLRFLITSNRLLSGLIGKEGQGFKQISATSNCSLFASPALPDTHERIVTIRARNVNDAKQGFRLFNERIWSIMESIEQKKRDTLRTEQAAKAVEDALKDDNSAATSASEVPYENKPLTETVRLLIPRALAGKIIGVGGEKIKEIKNQTGADIRVSTFFLPKSTERAVVIRGTGSSIKSALDAMDFAIDLIPEIEAAVPYVCGNDGIASSMRPPNSMQLSDNKTAQNHFERRDAGKF
eukprot:Colp12_sorted_trinity150504_noHs@34722